MNSGNYKALKQSVNSLDTPQQGSQYIEATLHSNDNQNSHNESVSPRFTQKNIITDYATPQHRHRANAQIQDPKHTTIRFNDNDIDNNCAQCIIHQKKIIELSQQLNENKLFRVPSLTTSIDNNDLDDDEDDVDLKEWTAIQSNTMECIGSQQQKIEELQIKNQRLQYQLQHKQTQISALNEQHNKIGIKLENIESILNEKEKIILTINREKESLNQDNNKLNEMYNILKSKRATDHSQCHELIKQHYNQKKMKENALDTLKSKYDELLIKDKHHMVCNRIIDELKKDLSHAQRSILEMTNVVGVKQKLPTVQETLGIFHSIRDQQHHNTSTELKKYIKLLNENWHKYYINQLVHELMFDALIKCYVAVTLYRKHLFEVIAQELNMKYTLKQAFNKNDNEDEQLFIDTQIQRILSNRFGSYFKDNYKSILKTKEIANKVKHDVLREKYAQCLAGITSNVLSSLNEYIVQCCGVCWIMILQDPSLHLTPIGWMESTDNVLFDDRRHKRVLGSDRKCMKILYYVWPVIARNHSILDDQKMDVVLRHEMYSPNM